MSSSSQADHRISRRRELQDAASALVRSVMASDWHPATASARVFERARGDRTVLLLLRARVAQRLAGRPSPLDQRAAATLDGALRLDDDHSTARLPHPRQDTPGPHP